jgi:hypothetical protein
MKSQASDTTLVGAGSRAPGSEQRSCQTNSVSEMTMSGGSTTCIVWRATSPMRSRAGRIGGLNGTISAVASGTGMSAAMETAALLTAGITRPS